MKGDTMENERQYDIEELYRNLSATHLGDENYALFMSALNKLTDEELALLSRMVQWNLLR